MANALVTITINPFTGPFVSPSGAGTACLASLQPYDMIEVNDPARRITVRRPTGTGSAQPGSPPTAYVAGSITIAGTGGTKLNLTVVDNAATPATYIVCGVVFNLTADGVAYRAKCAAAAAAAGGNPTGRDNFTDFSCNADSSVTLNDADVLAGTNNYEFLLLIQNSVGGMAIVDPQITNTA